MKKAVKVDAYNNSRHSKILLGAIIPSPFKNSLFWFESTKKRSKEIIVELKFFLWARPKLGVTVF